MSLSQTTDTLLLIANYIQAKSQAYAIQLTVPVFVKKTFEQI